MIDKLFGSKTRVKLLHLFLNNPGTPYYVREITRLVDEQINSVRRELSNMLSIGIITSDNSDNKLYYEVNQRYEHYVALRAIFADQIATPVVASSSQSGTVDDTWVNSVKNLPGLRAAVAAGMLVKDSVSNIDLLLVGNISNSKVQSVVKGIESSIGRELNYTVMTYDEFYYRLSLRDKFITEIIQNNHTVVADTDSILKG